jgi:HEPN domain-containing protein
MPPDPARVADTRAWLEKATLDLRGAGIDLAATPPLVGDALFHCQQAVEKALKALLAWHDEPFRKTHDLVELGALCTTIDDTLEPLLRKAAPLTEYAWKFRYPGDVPDPTAPEAEAALAVASRVVEAIRERVPREASPLSND